MKSPNPVQALPRAVNYGSRGSALPGYLICRGLSEAKRFKGGDIVIPVVPIEAAVKNPVHVSDYCAAQHFTS